MLKNRVIPILLIKDGSLVKTRCFKDPAYIGDPLNAIRVFNEKEVDEIIVLDISEGRQAKGPDFEIIKSFSDECFMPVCYGGGISSLKQVEIIFNLGIEKVSIQSTAFTNKQMLKDISRSFGNQSLVASVDIKRNSQGQPELYSSYVPSASKINWIEHIAELVELGVGEILLNSVDRDGTMSGMDLELIRIASGFIKSPLIAAGGVGKLADIRDAVKAGADAVAAGAFFVYFGPYKSVLITYPEYKQLEDILKKADGL